MQGAGAVRKVNCGGPAHADYAADWPPGEIAPAQDRSLPAGDFYRDWARAEFGPEVAEDAGRLFARVDGRLPRPTTWVNGPGGIAPDGRPWEETLKGYAFLGEMEALRPRVAGAGHRARFDYWLAQFRGMLATERVKHVWARCSAAMKEVGAQPDPAVRRDLAERRVLPLRRELIAAVGDVYRDLLATVSTPGEMGTVDNWERHILPEVLTKPGGELAKLLGRDLPADAQPSRAYAGPLRVIVPTVRGSVDAGEALRLKVILPAQSEVADAALFWRPLGRGAFTRVALRHLARGVYGATLPPAAGTALEYYIQASTRAGERACFPPTAPALCQTVVVMPRGE